MIIHRKTVLIFSAIFSGLFFFLFLLTRIVFLPVLLAVFLSSAAAVLLFEIIILIRLTRLNKSTEKKLKESYGKIKETQSQLIQSAKMASIGMLAGGVAHEINNPLIGVLNNVQLIRIIQEQKKDFNLTDFNELLSIIEESALRCKRITQSLLDFSRESKGLLQPVSLNEVVEKVVMVIGYEMKLQNISVHKELKPDLPLALGNFQLLQQVVFDIISNAKWAIEKKAQKTEGIITVGTGFAAQDKQVYISISDNGIGIPKDDLDKVFEPFFTTKAIGEGTGLGLSIAYSIVKEHKGNIEVESTVGKGTVFKIRLPVPEV